MKLQEGAAGSSKDTGKKNTTLGGSEPGSKENQPGATPIATATPTPADKDIYSKSFVPAQGAK